MKRFALPLLGVLLAAPTLRAAPVSMPDIVRAYEADARSIGAFYDLRWSDASLDRHQQLIADWRARLAALDHDALPASGRIDWLLLRNDLDREEEGLRVQRERLQELNELVPFRTVVAELEQARWRGEAVDPAAAATRVEGIGQAIKDVRARLEAGRKKDDAEAKQDVKPLKVEPVRALRAARLADALRTGLKRWFEFYHGYQPDFSWWVKSTHEETAKQLEEYAKFLREEIAGVKGKDEDPLLGQPIGRDALVRALRLEFIAYSPEEVLAIGERELAWCEAEWKKAAAEMGLGDDWKAALDRVKNDFVPPGQQDELVGQVARDALAFVRAQDFVTVPPLCEETWRMAMISPEGLKTIPYAAYSGQEMMVAYARDDMKQADKLMVMRGNNRYSTRLTVPHELIPGHHLQLFVAARENPHRRIFGTPFYIEGWALYCELRLWELGWPRTPQERIGLLFWRANRAARIVTTVRFHLGQLKPDEMVQYLMDHVGHEKFGATSEVRRYISDDTPPLYQAAYLLGGRQLHTLRAEWVKPGGWTERQFNDAVLAQNAMPIELLRAALRGEKLSRGAQPAWKF
jgi:uncharacterized protein (DUF885 family)